MASLGSGLRYDALKRMLARPQPSMFIGPPGSLDKMRGRPPAPGYGAKQATVISAPAFGAKRVKILPMPPKDIEMVGMTLTGQLPKPKSIKTPGSKQEEF